MRQQVGVIIFRKVDPPRRATGEHRQRGGRIFINQRAFQAAQQLGALLHDGEVRGKVGIEHRGKAHLTQGGHHLASHPRAGRVAKLFAQRGANGWRGLHNHCFGRIAQRLPDFVNVATLADGAHRTNRGALAALHAGHAIQIAGKCRADDRIEPTPLREQCAHPLHLAAHGDAAAAFDALGVVAHQPGGAGIVLGPSLGALVGHGAYPHVAGQPAQFAIIIALANLAIAVMLGEQQLHHLLARVAGARAIDVNNHPFRAGRGTSRHQRAGALHLHEAHPARAQRVALFQIAKRRDMNPRLPRRLQDCGTFGHRQIPAIDANMNHVASPRTCPVLP